MTKRKRTTLPAVTAEDLTRSPELLRRTPTGWAWRCEQCRQFASTETSRGTFVCCSHREDAHPVADHSTGVTGLGGSATAADFTNLVSHERIESLVASYKVSKPGTAEPDENMLYLRAYIEEMRGLSCYVAMLRSPILALINWADEFPIPSARKHETQTARQLLDLIDLPTGWIHLMGCIQEMLALSEALDSRLMERGLQVHQMETETRQIHLAAEQVKGAELALARVVTLATEQMSRAQLLKFRDSVQEEIEKLN